MFHQQATTYEVEAQKNCARQMPSGLDGMGAIELQPHFAPVARRTLLAAINTASRDLGLRAASVMVLDALMSCLPCKDSKTGVDMPVTPRTLLTVYAANDTLCFRAKGITDRQLRRHLERLEQVGLIRRRDSANGKRFPVKRSGQVIGAFGIDLSPLLARSDEILAVAKKRREEIDELRGLRACANKLRLECLRLRLDEAAHAFVEGAHTILRRASTTLTEARAVLGKLRVILSGKDRVDAARATEEFSTANSAAGDLPDQQAETAPEREMTATDGQNDRHKEPQETYTKKPGSETIHDVWRGLTTLSAFYPEEPRSEHAVMRVIFEFGKMLGITQNTLAMAVNVMGLKDMLAVEDRIAAKADRISNPDGYLRTILKGVSADRGARSQLFLNA